jgi:DNA-binding XRE family transcriptional regulator
MSPDQYRKQREKLGLTQAGLASLLEVTRETVNRRESGEQPITHEAALAISSLRPSKTKKAADTSNTP